MASPARVPWWKIALCLLGILVLAALGLEGSIRWSAYRVSVLAADRFPGDRVQALMAQVECTSCPLKLRQDAVWALGQLGDARAVPVLRAYLTGHPCNHSKELCQYELQKAIRHLENGIPLRARLRFQP
jgi:hypothetical protein